MTPEQRASLKAAVRIVHRCGFPGGEVRNAIDLVVAAAQQVLDGSPAESAPYRGGRAKRPFSTGEHDVHWLVRHSDGSLDTFAEYRIRGAMIDEMRKADIGFYRLRSGSYSFERADLDFDTLEAGQDDLDARIALRAAVATLPERSQAVLTLHYGNDMSLEEVGEAMGFSKSLAVQIHNHAVAKLRVKLKGWE